MEHGQPARRHFVVTTLTLAGSAACAAVAVTYVHVLALSRGVPNAQFVMGGIGFRERPYYYGCAVVLAALAVLLSPLWARSLYGTEHSRRWKLAVLAAATPVAALLWSLLLGISVFAVESRVSDPFDDEELIELADNASHP